MKDIINVLMVDNESSIKVVKEYLSKQISTNVAINFSTSDGLEAINIIQDYQDEIDLIIMDTILPSLDGIGILKYLKNNNINKKVIIYSNYTNESIIKSLSLFEISFFINKNTSTDILVERINDAYSINYEQYTLNDNKSLMRISKLLHDLGMPSHIKGYMYIRDSIVFMYNNPDSLGGITKEIYPYIAEKYNTTSSRVERAIRHAIEVSWSRGDYDLMEEIFGHSVDFDRAKPTNSEFLATLADKMTLEDNKKHAINY